MQGIFSVSKDTQVVPQQIIVCVNVSALILLFEFFEFFLSKLSLVKLESGASFEVDRDNRIRVVA